MTLAERPCSNLDEGQVASQQERQQHLIRAVGSVGFCASLGAQLDRPAANAGIDIAQACVEPFGREPAEPCCCAEGGGAHGGIVGRQPGIHNRMITEVSRDHDVGARWHARSVGRGTLAPVAHRPPDPERVCHPARRRWPRRILWVLPSAAFGGFWGFAALYPLHYVAIRPGLSVNIGPRLSVAGGPDHPATGRVLFATVLLQRKITLFEALDGWRRRSIDVYSERALFGDESPQQSVERQRAQMDASKTVASIVAQRRLGFAARGEGARVISVGSGLPVARVLHPGDVIMAVGGVRICLRDDARLGLKGHAPGDAVSVTVRRGGIGPELTASFELAQDANTGAPLLGVEIETVRCRPPFEVTVDTDSVLGSSPARVLQRRRCAPGSGKRCPAAAPRPYACARS